MELADIRALCGRRSIRITHLNRTQTSVLTMSSDPIFADTNPVLLCAGAENEASMAFERISTDELCTAGQCPNVPPSSAAEEGCLKTYRVNWKWSVTRRRTIQLLKERQGSREGRSHPSRR